jgi:hypothetical protein
MKLEPGYPFARFEKVRPWIVGLTIAACCGCSHGDAEVKAPVAAPLGGALSKSSKPPPSGKPIVGVWKIDMGTSVIENAKNAPAAILDSMAKLTLTFDADGTYHEEPSTMSGTYRLDGNKVILKMLKLGSTPVTSDDGSKNPFVLAGDGSSLTMTSADSKSKIVLKKAG